jgi:hypothetical protein
VSEDEFNRIDPDVPIRLVDGDDVDIPLWSNQHGLLFVEREELVAFGFSSELAADIEEWGDRSPSTTVRGSFGKRRPWATQAERDARGVDLVRRMREELGHVYDFVYQADRPRPEPRRGRHGGDRA